MDYSKLNEGIFKGMTIMALNVELSDLLDIKRGRPSLFYGGYFNKHGRYPTEQEIQIEIDRVTKEREEALNDWKQ